MSALIHIVSFQEKLKLKNISSQATDFFKNKKEAQKKLQKDVEKLSKLQEVLYAENKHALLLIFQGMDTSGKDSMIKHVMSGINPQGCEVHSFKPPSAEELSHDYLWRCAKLVPGKGKIGIFNRSYYEEVTIARVHHEILSKENLSTKLTKNHLWERRCQEISNYEKYLNENGITILKFFLHISENEQKQRILKRIEDKTKHWKFDVSDIREREYWDKYIEAYEKAISLTSTDFAPWHIVPSDQKMNARISVAEIIVKKLQQMKLAYPQLSTQGEIDLKKAKELLGKN
jgi:PPK2 family polyphosphate:nucleotide phosphotransferase